MRFGGSSMRRAATLVTTLALVLTALVWIPPPVAGAATSPVNPDNRPTTIAGASNGYLPASQLTTIDANCRIANAAAFAMRSMMAAALAQGVNLFPEECYRDYPGQVDIRYYWCAKGQCSMAAVPGTSNHGWGKAVDFRDQLGELGFSSPGYAWMNAHAAQFGFNNPGSLVATEPWHWEWVGDGGRQYPGHPMPAPANAPAGRVNQAYWRAGGTFSLGSLRTAEHRDAAGRGTVAVYTSGALFFPDGRSPRAVIGPTWTKYNALGNVAGWLGYPTSDASAAADQLGRRTTFDHGEIEWSSASGAHPLAGSTLTLWRFMGAHRSALGYPTDDGASVGDGVGTVTRFEHGHIWTGPTVGTFSTFGPVDTRYLQDGGPTGVLGYPTAEAKFVPGAALQRFARGTIFASGRGAYGFAAGPQLDLYWLLGGPGGSLGVPVREQSRAGSVTTGVFAHGSIVVDSGSGVSTVQRSGAASATTTGVITADAWIDQVYRVLLGHPASGDEQLFLASGINGGTPIWQIAEALASKADAKAVEISALYEQALGRTVDAAGLAYWTGRLQRDLSWLQVEGLVYGSPEWFNGHGGTDSTFVEALYQALLGRAADSGGLNFWVAQLEAGVPRPTLVAKLVSTPENRRIVVNAEYQRVLGRVADPAGLAYWSTWIGSRHADPAHLDASLIVSQEAVLKVGRP